MARGFISGVLWGGVLGVAGAGVFSVMTPGPQAPQVGQAAPRDVTAPAEVAGQEPQAGGSDSAPSRESAQPQAAAPNPDSLAALDGDAQRPAAQPETGAASDLASPAAPAPATDTAAPQAEDPVLPNPQALAPMMPQDADELSISTDPAQPPAPQAENGSAGFAPPREEETAALTLPESGAETPPGTVAPQAPDAASPAPQAPEAAQDTPPAPTESAETASTGPRIGTPAVSLTEREGAVAVNRPGSAAADPETEAEPALAETEAASGPALTRNRVDFENPEQKPLMAIILIDDGKSPTAGAAGLAALSEFPYPLSFAIPATAPDAAARALVYRKAGFEVLALVDLPEGSTPADVESLLPPALEALPDAVALLEGVTSGIQADRALADQVTAILAETGHGLVTQDKGLNTVPKLARKEGVPADPVFRDFDGKDQQPQVIRRFLDQAAFKAGQEGGVIMLGRLRPDTITALLLWGLQDRAGKVALAPISAVLGRPE